MKRDEAEYQRIHREVRKRFGLKIMRAAQQARRAKEKRQ